MKQFRWTLSALALFSPTVVVSHATAQNGNLVLPKSMVALPGGSTEVGSDAEELVELVTTINLAPRAQLGDLKRLMSELGKREAKIEPFFMSAHLVTNEQYKIFVEKTGHRFPFHWWRFGREDDYNQRLPEVNAVKAEENKDILYWQNTWKALPWTIPADDALRTKPTMEQYPVTYVSWKDALAFAAWAGMRLPTEAEWIYAAQGSERKEFLWGDDVKAYPIPRGSRYDKLWEVGHWADKAQGAFPIGDMVHGLWEWTNDLGFFAYDYDAFEKERKDLLRDKLLRKKDDREVESVRKFKPEWKGDKVVCKGGWYGSSKAELRLQTRAPQESFQTRAGIGFRLAKSEPPALDLAASMIKLDYDYSYFGGERAPNLDDQVGIERYELSADGRLINGYHALSLVPVNHMSKERNLTLPKLVAGSLERPLAVGTLVVTGKLASPEIGRGIYTVAYRGRGMTDELKDALKDGRKALQLAEKSGKDVEAGDWQKVLNRFGITDEECLAGDVKFIRLKPGDLQVSTEENMLLLRDFQGKYITSWRAPKPTAKDGKYQAKGASVSVAKNEAGNEVVTFDFGVPPDPREKRSAYTFQINLELPADMAGGDDWRLPGMGVAAAGGTHAVGNGGSSADVRRNPKKK